MGDQNRRGNSSLLERQSETSRKIEKLTLIFTPTDTRLPKVTKEVEIEVTPALTPATGSITTTSGASGSTPITGTTSSASVAIKTLGAGLEKANASGSSLSVTAKADYSGKTTVTITVNDEARSIDLIVNVTVLPGAVTQVSFTLDSWGASSISWQSAKGAKSYYVKVDGKTICMTEKSSCETDKSLGPNSSVSVTPLGENQLQGVQAIGEYKNAAKRIEVLRLIFPAGKATLTSTVRKKLSGFISELDNLGFREVEISQNSNNHSRLTLTRIRNTEGYIVEKIRAVQIGRVKSTGLTLYVSESNQGSRSNGRTLVITMSLP